MRRLGNFLIMLGFFLVVLFLLSDIAASPQFGLFLVGAALAALGFVFRSIAKPVERIPSGRFQTINRLRGRSSANKKSGSKPVDDISKKK
jgi:hypothetical protein